MKIFLISIVVLLSSMTVYSFRMEKPLDRKKYFKSDVNLKTYRSATGQSSLQHVLADVTAKTTPVELAKIFQIADQTLAAGVDINSKADTGLTALHDAVLFDNLRVVDYLLQHGAKVSEAAGPGKFEGQNSFDFAIGLNKKKQSPYRAEIIERLRSALK